VSQETVAHILGFERQASQIYKQAQQEAAQRVEDAQTRAAALRKERLDRVREQAEVLQAEAREEVEAGRLHTIAEVEAEMARLEEIAEKNLDAATTLILERVAGRR
jgi:F0F1-type ATP synthase membrane subunit b/b'